MNAELAEDPNLDGVWMWLDYILLFLKMSLFMYGMTLICCKYIQKLVIIHGHAILECFKYVVLTAIMHYLL